MTDFVYLGKPGHIYDGLDAFNQNEYENKMTLKHIENKHILIKIAAEDEDENETVVKVKFYE